MTYRQGFSFIVPHTETSIAMIIETSSGRSYDTESDLSAPERHILQKLLLWESMVGSIQEFKEREETAIAKGWNNSGPVRPGAALSEILRDLEKKVRKRLEKDSE